MYQQITLIGNLGKTPEMRYTPDGTPVCTFSVAINKRWISNDGTPAETTRWFRVTCWRRLAEVTNQYLTKGRQVMVVGEMKEPSAWIDDEGNARASLEVTARTVKFLGANGNGDTGSQDLPDDEAF